MLVNPPLPASLFKIKFIKLLEGRRDARGEAEAELGAGSCPLGPEAQLTRGCHSQGTSGSIFQKRSQSLHSGPRFFGEVARGSH